MLAILYLLAMFVADLFKSRRRLEAENLFLRHQLNIDRGNQASHGGVAGTADRRGISVGYGAALSDPRQ
ncbi:MAG: hypothetical protein WCD83_03530 [Pseudolabrys sp.]